MSGAEGPPKFRQFTSTDKKLLIRDVEFWASSLDALLQFYKETKVESVEDKEAKAIACARLSGLGYAMAEHFECAIENLINTEAEGTPELDAVEAAAERLYKSGETHRNRLESAVKANAN